MDKPPNDHSKTQLDSPASRGLLRRDVVKAGMLAAIATLCTPQAIAGEIFRSKPDDWSFVNSELRPSLKAVQAVLGSQPPLSAATLADNRHKIGSYTQPPAATPVFEKRVINGLAGGPDVAVYVINAKAGAHRPAILHTHGGGFVLGHAQMSIGALQPIAATLDCTIVTVDFRLAPEATYAASMEDNYAALLWLHDHATELGVDAKRIAVMGESSGGGHAALLALVARDRGEVPLVFQALIYPMLDDRTGTTQNPPPPIGSFLWTAEDNRFGWRSFLGQAPGTSGVPERAVPARYKNLAGLPPAFIGVGSIDLFVDEDIDYARRLINAGVMTQLIVVPGAFHVFDGVAPQTTIAQHFTAAKIDALRSAFTASTT